MLKVYELSRDELVFVAGYIVGAYCRERQLPLETDGLETIVLQALADALEKVDKGDTTENFVEDALAEIEKMTGNE